jgi:hypothetical protein
MQLIVLIEHTVCGAYMYATSVRADRLCVPQARVDASYQQREGFDVKSCLPRLWDIMDPASPPKC